MLEFFKGPDGIRVPRSHWNSKEVGYLGLLDSFENPSLKYFLKSRTLISRGGFVTVNLGYILIDDLEAEEFILHYQSPGLSNLSLYRPKYVCVYCLPKRSKTKLLWNLSS